jgi:amino acid transporter
MKLRWLRPFIVLLAAMIVLISNFVLKRPIISALIWLLGTIIVFYIISSIVIRVIERAIHSEKKEEISDQPEDDQTKETGKTEQDE